MTPQKKAARNGHPVNTVKPHKGSSIERQAKTIFEYWQRNIATASMVSAATGVPHKNICRYKRDLEKSGLLWEVKKTICAQTGFSAWYCTCNPDLFTAGITGKEGGCHA